MRTGPFRVVTVASGLENPWGLAFLPEGRMLVTERPGRLRIVRPDGTLSEPVKGTPEVYAVGQGGLLDVALDPDFVGNRLVYLSYAEADGEVAGTAVARGRLVETDDGQARLEDLQVIFQQQPSYGVGSNHFGSRIVFMPDGSLFVTLGERYSARDEAQNPGQPSGQARAHHAGRRAPMRQPEEVRSWGRPEIWSIGHRNGAGRRAQSGDRHAVDNIEHGARGGDEINVPEAGKNSAGR